MGQFIIIIMCRIIRVDDKAPLVFMQVALIAYNREWGPMLRAERRAQLTGKVAADNAHLAQVELDANMEPDADTPLLWWNGEGLFATKEQLIHRT